MFEGASEDGRRVFFLSEQPLVDGAPAEGMKLYDERLEGTQPSSVKVAEIEDVSNEGLPAVNPEVQGVVRISEDGERVYFVAKGKLTGSDEVAGREPESAEPVAGADNLYVYEPESAGAGAHHTVFVATLLTPGEEATLATEEAEESKEITEQGEKAFRYEFERVKAEFEPAEAKIIEEYLDGKIEIAKALELLGEVEEARGEADEAVLAKERVFIANTMGTLGPKGTLPEDQSVWAIADGRPAQTTPSGDNLMFVSSAKLTPQDTSSIPQVFAYDAGDESLTRVSIGQAGPASGNVDTFRDAPQIPPSPQGGGVDLPTAADTGLALSEDGSEMFFTSAADLAPQAEPGTTNVYEYHEGHVYMVSGGGDASTVNGKPSVTLLGTDPSGQDAFFLSQSKLVPQYGDTQVALYDALGGGGFPAPVLEPGCLGKPAAARRVSLLPTSLRGARVRRAVATSCLRCLSLRRSRPRRRRPGAPRARGSVAGSA